MWTSIDNTWGSDSNGTLSYIVAGDNNSFVNHCSGRILQQPPDNWSICFITLTHLETFSELQRNDVH